MKQLYTRLLIGVLLLYTTTTVAQHISLLTVEDGLPQSFVSGIVEDEDGFIWVATRNGLAKYDGHQFKVFQHAPERSETIASNFISHLKKGAGNTLWMRFENGSVDLFDVHTESSKHIIASETIEKHRVKIPKRSWLATQTNLFWFVRNDKELVSFPIEQPVNDTSIQSYTFNGFIYGLLEDTKDQVWVLMSETLLRYDATSKDFETIALPYASSFYNVDESPALHERANGELMWIDKRYICFYNPEKESFRKIKIPEAPNYNTKWIYTGPDGKDYFEINKSVYSYDDLSGVVQKAQMDIGSNRETQAFLVDKSGLIWVGPNTDGIYKIDLSTSFVNFTYDEGFLADLMAKEFGASTDTFFDLSAIANQPLAPAYYMRTAVHSQKLWIALGREVVFYDFTKEQMTAIPELPPDPEVDGPPPISGLTITEEGTPLVIDQKGNMYLFQYKDNEWAPFTISSLPKPYDDVLPNDIVIDKQKLWITTDANGLLYMDIFKNKIVNITKEHGLPTNNLLELHLDKVQENILWIGSSQGLIQLDKNNFSSTVFSKAEGLPDNVIYSIYGDKSGYLWLGTNKGLCSFNSTSYKHRTFSKQHGLYGSEFNRFHKLQLPNEKVAFGGINSGVIFDPLFIKEDKFNPKSAITKIKLNNVDVREKYKTLQPNNIDSLSLPYNENTIAIAFTALQFSQPQDIVYRYRLKGYDNEWVTVGNKREAVYTKIPPGNYLFEVNATNTTGEWSNFTKTLMLSISPPFWNTWWAWLLYILFVGSGAYILVNYRIRQKVFTKEIALKSKEAAQLRELDTMKTQFFSNITHELRTPLSLIIGPAELLKNKNEEHEQKRLLAILSKNAESLLQLSNQLLDIAKLEAGVLKPKMLRGDVVLAVKKIVKAFSEAASSKQIKIVVDTPERAMYYFSPNTLERILSNLLSNALKFSTSNSEIHIRLQELETGISLLVTDYGTGIPKEELPDIFKRFYKGNENGNYPGSGIGLSLVHDLVKLHNGTITVDSTTVAPTSTSFLVTLPFEKAPLENLQALETLLEAEEPLRIEDNGKPTVLVVEDNEELANFIKYSLQATYNIVLAENGVEGLNTATALIPDLILSDVLMDGMNGLELCKAIKQTISTNHIPVLLLTAKSDTESKLQGLSYGADDYITKPFHVSELLMRIENRLAHEKRQREFLQKQIQLLPNAPDYATKNEVHNEFFDKLYQIVDNHLEDELFNVEKLALELHMSRTSLHRKIKSMTDITTGEVIKAYRLKKAVSMLTQQYTVSEVAYKTGFGSPSYFTKCFKEAYGMTPTEYLQKHNLHP